MDILYIDTSPRYSEILCTAGSLIYVNTAKEAFSLLNKAIFRFVVVYNNIASGENGFHPFWDTMATFGCTNNGLMLMQRQSVFRGNPRICLIFDPVLNVYLRGKRFAIQKGPEKKIVNFIFNLPQDAVNRIMLANNQDTVITKLAEDIAMAIAYSQQ